MEPVSKIPDCSQNCIDLYQDDGWHRHLFDVANVADVAHRYVVLHGIDIADMPKHILKSTWIRYYAKFCNCRNLHLIDTDTEHRIFNSLPMQPGHLYHLEKLFPMLPREYIKNNTYSLMETVNTVFNCETTSYKDGRLRVLKI